MAKSRETDALIPAGQMARLLDLSLERLRQLAAEGWFPRAVAGQYPLVATIQGYVKFLRDAERRSARSKPAADLQAARQREIELRIAEREAKLIEAEDVEAEASRIVATYRDCFAKLGRKITRDRVLAASVDQALSSATSRAERRFAEAIAALRAGRDPLGMTADNDA